MAEELYAAPDVKDWTPPGYEKPEEDDVVVDHEHPHPLEVDQTPTTEGR